MDSREMLRNHIQTLTALTRGGISRGFSSGEEDEDEVQSTLRTQWATQINILRRVLGEQGEPTERLLEWRERTQGFMDKYPEREGWTDREGQTWNARHAMDAIDKLLEQIEAWEMEAEEYEFEEEDDEF